MLNSLNILQVFDVFVFWSMDPKTSSTQINLSIRFSPNVLVRMDYWTLKAGKERFAQNDFSYPSVNSDSYFPEYGGSIFSNGSYSKSNSGPRRL